MGCLKPPRRYPAFADTDWAFADSDQSAAHTNSSIPVIAVILLMASRRHLARPFPVPLLFSRWSLLSFKWLSTNLGACYHQASVWCTPFNFLGEGDIGAATAGCLAPIVIEVVHFELLHLLHFNFHKGSNAHPAPTISLPSALGNHPNAPEISDSQRP